MICFTETDTAHTISFRVWKPPVPCAAVSLCVKTGRRYHSEEVLAQAACGLLMRAARWILISWSSPPALIQLWRDCGPVKHSVAGQHNTSTSRYCLASPCAEFKKMRMSHPRLSFLSSSRVKLENPAGGNFRPTKDLNSHWMRCSWPSQRREIFTKDVL